MPLLIALLATLGPIGIDMYLPSIPAMAEAMGSSEGSIQFSLMTFFAGLMLGQLVYGPLSDKFGRKPLIYTGLSIFYTRFDWLRLGSNGDATANDSLCTRLRRFDWHGHCLRHY